MHNHIRMHRSLVRMYVGATNLFSFACRWCTFYRLDSQQFHGGGAGVVQSGERSICIVRLCVHGVQKTYDYTFVDNTELENERKTEKTMTKTTAK